MCLLLKTARANKDMEAAGFRFGVGRFLRVQGLELKV